MAHVGAHVQIGTGRSARATRIAADADVCQRYDEDERMLGRMDTSDDRLPDEPQEILRPIQDVVPGAQIVALPDDVSWVGALILIKTRDESGHAGWSVRRTEGLTDEELLGMVCQQADMLRERALVQGR